MKIKQNKNYEKRNTKQNCDQHEETIKQKTTVKKKQRKKEGVSMKIGPYTERDIM